MFKVWKRGRRFRKRSEVVVMVAGNGDPFTDRVCAAHLLI